MGLLKRKLSQAEIMSVQHKVELGRESANYVNATLKPDVFFKRLNMLLDILMALSAYDNHPLLKKGEKPSATYKRTIKNLELTVNDFIDRAFYDKMTKIQNLKTYSGKIKSLDEFSNLMIESFENPNSFWTGSYLSSGPLPHYVGSLYMQGNIDYLNQVIETYKNSIYLSSHPAFKAS